MKPALVALAVAAALVAAVVGTAWRVICSESDAWQHRIGGMPS